MHVQIATHESFATITWASLCRRARRGRFFVGGQACHAHRGKVHTYFFFLGKPYSTSETQHGGSFAPLNSIGQRSKPAATLYKNTSKVPPAGLRPGGRYGTTQFYPMQGGPITLEPMIWCEDERSRARLITMLQGQGEMAMTLALETDGYTDPT